MAQKVSSNKDESDDEDKDENNENNGKHDDQEEDSTHNGQEGQEASAKGSGNTTTALAAANLSRGITILLQWLTKLSQCLVVLNK